MTEEELLQKYKEYLDREFPRMLRDFIEWFYDPDRDLYTIDPYPWPTIPKKYPIVPYKGDTHGPSVSS